MFKSLSLLIGFRFSRARQRNKMVSFISMSSTIGIAVGVAVIIIGLSAMNGFERELENRVLSVIPHGELEGVRGPISNWNSIIEQSEQHPEVVAAAPYVKITALAEKGSLLKAIEVRGVNPSMERGVSDIPNFVTKNAWQNLKAGERQIILGKGVAEKLSVTTGEYVSLMIPTKGAIQKVQSLKRVRLKVIGLLSLNGQIDHSLALIPITDAQKYSNFGTSVTGVALKFKNVLKANSILREVGGTLDTYVYLKSWQQKFGFLYRDIQLVRIIMYLVMVLVIGVASFNIVSTLMMAVKDRASDIAILRTMGANNRLIKKVFMWQGILSGVIGSLLGSIVGMLIASNLTYIITCIEGIVGHKFLSGDIYFVDFLPSKLEFSDVALVSMTAIALSLVATFYPASRASKLQPAAVLSSK